MTETGPIEGVAIVGYAGRFPQANSIDQFWNNLAAGKDCFTEFPVDHIVAEGVPRDVAVRPDYVRRAPVIADPSGFDARFFRYSPKEAELIDPQQRLLLECAWEALEHAGHDPHRFPGQIGIWAGSGVNNYLLKNIMPRGTFEEVADFQAIISNDKDYLASRIAYKLDLRGPAVVVQTACSTSLVAVHLACLSLMTYQCDMALAGAVFLQTPRARGYLYREGDIFSSDGYCRTFDRSANGTVLGEGCGVVVLRRLDDAIADGDNILAVIRGSAVNNDGAARAGYTAPGLAGQAELITLAQTVAGVRADDISYIEAHGTGTPLGDPIEVSALTQAFRRSTGERRFCGLGAVKTNIGHLDVAAGMAGLIKTICALQHRKIPPTIHFREPNPELRLAESPFYVVDRLMDWLPRRGRRIAGVSSFGMGGTNAHVILEEYAGQRSCGKSEGNWHLLPLSAVTSSALRTQAKNLADHMHARTGTELSDLSWTLTAGRSQLKHRQCVVAGSFSEAAARLAASDALFTVEGVAERMGAPVVFLFSGQGTQYPGMGAELYSSEPVFRESLNACSRLLGPLAGQATLIDILCEGNEETRALVNQTTISQPALFAFEYALARLLDSYGLKPAAVVGHSIGEYAAACEAGVFSLGNALQLVRERGRLMQSMEPGTMIAIPRSEAEVRAMLPAELDLAVVNAPSITVVSGPTPAITVFANELEARGIPCRRLHTSHGFHSRMMERAAREFDVVAHSVQMQAPNIPLASNLTGGWVDHGHALDPGYWSKHLRNTVRFSDNLAAIAQRFDRAVLLEIGPGNTLCSIARQHGENVAKLPAIPSVRHPRQQAPDQAFFLRALGLLWCHGAEIDLRLLHKNDKRQRLALPTYPFEREAFWIGPKNGRMQTTGGEKRQDRNLLKKVFAFPGVRRNGSGNGSKRQLREEDLAKIWCKVLGLSRVSVDDNFFELGGHSLLAVSIMTEVEKSFGMRLPLALLIEAPTIRELVRRMNGNNGASVWSNLVPLYTKGAKAPFFLMHSHGGNILEYHALADLLKNDRPVYALQCSGLDGSPVREASVEEMGARYLEEILRVQPKGPYYLGGFCFGGYLGLEIAHLLRARQEKVELLVLINSGTHLFNVYRPELGPVGRKWCNIRDRAALEWIGFHHQPRGRKLEHVLTRARRTSDLVLNKFETMLDLLPSGSPFRVRKHSLVYHLEKIAEANDRAWERYRPKPYDGKVLFLRALRQPLGIQPEPLLGWASLLTGDVHVHEVPGFRQNMLDEPNVPEVARCILEHLP